MRTFLAIILSILSLISFAQHNIIPEPASYESFAGKLTFEGILVIDKSEEIEVRPIIEQFNQYCTSVGLKQVPGNTVKVVLERSKTKLKREAYTLTVNEKGIQISASHYGGFFNGIQSLKQLIPPKATGKTTLNFCKINDEPRFEWRGLMLDVSRHFFTVEEVKAYLDQMSEFKFNTFHWHLTDDHGWRIEIKSLPKLTEIGAWRAERHGRFGKIRAIATAEEPKTYGGFYTQEQIKEVIKYAQDRNIRIVPEIDVPGHSMALLAAYPEYSTKGETVQVSAGDKFSEWFGDGSFKMYTENALDPSNEKVYDLLDKIYGEIAQLFPFEYIHMGGDECYKGYWEESEKVAKFMTKNKLKDMHELQAYFVSRVQKIIESKGKKMIGWDEITEGHLDQNAAVMSWQGMKGGIHAAKLGHKVVMSPTTFAYLDYMQGDLSVENYIYSSLSLKKTYEFEPVPDEVDAKYILGGQANLWTEAIPTLQYAFYMTYPRALSIAETLWSPKEKKDWNHFMKKIMIQFDRFETRNTNISKAVLDPIIKVYMEGDKVMCKLENNVMNSEIYFTINNTYPVNFGEQYTEPFEIPEGDLSLRVQTFLDGKSVGRMLQIHREDLLKRL